MIRTRNATAAPGRNRPPTGPAHSNDFIEQLEERKLLAATLKGSVLNVVGTNKSEEIVISRQAGKNGRVVVEIGNKRQTFAVGKKMKSIYVRGLNGHDQITVLETKKTALKLPTYLDGGAGNDLIFGSMGGDEIWGNTGNDTVNAGNGNDYIEGNTGNDSLSGDSGNDQMYGDEGNDELFGGVGDDTLGGDGEDRLKFWDNAAPAPIIGNDALDGGAGNDWLLGGWETRDLKQPWMKNGVDTMTGGSGDDVIDARGGDDVMTDAQTTDFVPFRDTVNDLSTGRTEYMIHVHVLLKVFVDGKYLEMPIGFGEFGVPMIHKDDPSDRDFIHLHDLNTMRNFKLGEIFKVLGVSFSKTHIGRHRVANGNKMTMNYRFQFEGNNAWRQSNAFDEWVIRSTDVRGTDMRDEITIQFTTAKKKK